MSQMRFPTDLAPGEYQELDRAALIDRCLNYQIAYKSLVNTISLYKKQLAVAGDHALQSSLIADLARQLNVSDLSVITKVAIHGVSRFYEAEYAALYLVDRETRFLTQHAVHPEETSPPALHLDADEDVLLVHFLKNHRDPIVLKNLAQYEQSAGREFRLLDVDLQLDRGGILCPLYIGTDDERLPIGIFVIAGKEDGFSRQDSDSAAMFSELLATAISSAQLLDKMSHLAETDGLTQLYNHRHFQQELDRAIAISKRYDVPLSLALVDIDHFKKFNDMHGHQAGDHVLRETARALRSAVRDNVDILARYGGEEFAVVMPQTEAVGGAIVGERIRSLVEEMKVTLGGESISITVSIGIGEYAPGTTKSILIDAADAGLYQAKAAGRNRVVTTPAGDPGTKI